MTALLLPPIITSTLWYLSLKQREQDPFSSPIPSHWLIESPRELPPSPHHSTSAALLSVVHSRKNLVDLSILCSAILLTHVSCSTWCRRRQRSVQTTTGILVEDVPPKAEGRRTWLYTRFSVLVSSTFFGLRLLSNVFSAVILPSTSTSQIQTPRLTRLFVCT